MEMQLRARDPDPSPPLMKNFDKCHLDAPCRHYRSSSIRFSINCYRVPRLGGSRNAVKADYRREGGASEVAGKLGGDF